MRELNYHCVRAWVRCEITERVPTGESAVFIARALKSHVARDVSPSEAGDALVHHNRTWHRLGEHSQSVS